MRRLFILLFLVASPGWAADQYFAECTGNTGTGIVTDPYCLDMDNDGINESFQEAWDGNATPVADIDFASGDKIILCCNGGSGTCVGAPTECIFALGDDGDGPGLSSEVGPLTPSISGTAINPIVVTHYLSEIIRLSGDADGDKVFDAGFDLQRFQHQTGSDYIHFECGTQNIIFEDIGAHDDGDIVDTNGSVGLSFDGCEFRGIGDKMWEWDKAAEDPTNTSHVHWALDAGGNTGRSLFIAANSCSFTFKNNLVHHVAGVWTRNVLNDGCNGEVDLFENNEYYNVRRVNDSWINWDWDLNKGKKITYRNNYIHDTTICFNYEHENFGHIMEDNICLCLGEWQMNANGHCFEAAITAFKENTGGNACANTTGQTVRRNIIGSRADGGASSIDCRADPPPANCGAYQSNPIRFEGGCISPGPGCSATVGCQGFEANTVIENNIILRYHPTEGGASDLHNAAISVQTNQVDVIKIRNNTIYDSEIGIHVNGSAVEIEPDIINNWIFKANDDGTRTEMELKLSSTADGGIINNNNFYHGGLGSPTTIVANVGGTTYQCNGINALGTGNICSQAKAVKCDDTHNCTDGTGADTVAGFCGKADRPCNGVSGVPGWDLHLDASDTVNKDAGTSTGGATDDIDKEARDGSPDIGADELIATTPPPAKLEGDGVLDGSATLAELNGWLDLNPKEANLKYLAFWIERTERWRREGKIK